MFWSLSNLKLSGKSRNASSRSIIYGYYVDEADQFQGKSCLSSADTVFIGNLFFTEYLRYGEWRDQAIWRGKVNTLHCLYLCIFRICPLFI